MKVNELLKELKQIRNDYGNVEVVLFDAIAYGKGKDDDTMPLEEVSFNAKEKRIVLY